MLGSGTFMLYAKTYNTYFVLLIFRSIEVSIRNIKYLLEVLKMS